MPPLNTRTRRDPKLYWKSRHDGPSYAYAVFYDRARRPVRKWFPSGMTNKEAAEEWFTDIKRAWRRGEFDPWRDADPRGPREAGVQMTIDRYFKANRHLGKDTVVTRRSLLESFARSLPAGLTLGYIEARHVETYLARPSERTNKPLSIHTRYGYKNILSYFFTWCIREGLLPRDPTADVKLPKRGRKLPEFLTPAEFERLLDAIDAIYEERRTREEARYRIAETDIIWAKEPIRFALATGLRISDVIRLGWDQVRLDAGVIMVDDRTKTGNEYAVPVLKLATDVLERQASARDANPELQDGLVFHSPTGGQLSKGNLQEIVRLAREKAKLPSAISYHSLRHTFATWMLMQTGNIRLVSSMLGHTTVSQTETYAHVALLAARQISPEEFDALGVSWWAYAGGTAAGYGAPIGGA